MASGQVAGILVAGGTGSRAGDGADSTPKQFRIVNGRPLWQWSYDVLESTCDELVFVAPASYVGELSASGITCVAGGETRQASVAAGLEAVSGDRVVVHDAARPLVTKELVDRVIAALDRADGATAAIPLRDTLLRVDDEVVTDVVDREHLWRVQTPQAFRRDVLEAAHRQAVAGGVTDASDDAQLVRALGKQVVVAQGDERNVKLTDPGDIHLIEALLERAR